MGTGQCDRESKKDDGYPPTAGRTSDEEREIESSFIKLEFGVRKSIRYHAKRKRFFENWHNFINALIILAGSSAFVALLSSTGTIALWLTAIVSTCAVIDLIGDLTKKGILHGELKQRFSALLKEICLSRKTAEDLQKLSVERILIESDEPTCMSLLDKHCHNEEAYSQGYDENYIYHLGWRENLRNLVSFDGYMPKTLKFLADSKVKKTS